jgi:hypothetical protein
VERFTLGWRVTSREILYSNIGDKRPLSKPERRWVDAVEENARRYRA